MKRIRMTSGIRRIPTLGHNEQRKARRLSTRIRVDYCPLVDRRKGLEVAGTFRGVADDISATGLFLDKNGYLKVGAMLHVMLRLPDVAANPIVCYARVARRDSAGYGIRFLRVRPADEDRLRDFIDTQLDRQGRLTA